METRTLEEVKEVLHYASQTKTCLTRIMLDNMVVPLPGGDFDVSMLREAVDLIGGRFETEASPTESTFHFFYEFSFPVYDAGYSIKVFRVLSLPIYLLIDNICFNNI